MNLRADVRTIWRKKKHYKKIMFTATAKSNQYI